MMILVKMVDKKILRLVLGRHKVLPPIVRMTRLATCVALLFPILLLYLSFSTCVAFPQFSFSAKLLSGMPLLP